MKILIISVGTRGDIEPFIPIARMMADKGHHVTCAFPEQFSEIVTNTGHDFYSLGSEYIDILNSDAGKSAMGGTSRGIGRLLAYFRLAAKQNEANKNIIRREYEIIENIVPDRILYNSKSSYPVIWGLKNKGKNILFSPVPYLHFVKDHPHILFHRNMGLVLNKITYFIADFGQLITLLITWKWAGLTGRAPSKSIRREIKSKKAVYTISPQLYPRKEYWPASIKVFGYNCLPATNNRKLPDNIKEFIKTHSKVLLISFGSMLNPDPEKISLLFTSVLERNNIAGIFITAGGGIAESTSYNRNLFLFIHNANYLALLPHVHGIIHHGGSGTTQLAFINGCTQLIIPHISDQHTWNKIVTEKRVGPPGIKMSKLSMKKLENKIIDLYNNESYSENAKHLAQLIKQENYLDELYDFIMDTRMETRHFNKY